jgi:transitional endoplasmic reticulum ATPase
MHQYIGSALDKVRELAILPLQHQHVLKHLNIDLPRGVLIYGPSGCGKTLLTQHVVYEANMNAVQISNIDQIDEVIQKHPCIGIVEDIDSKQHLGESLIAKWSSIPRGTIIIATSALVTNTSLRRSFDYEIQVSVPNKKDRLSLLKHLTKDVKCTNLDLNRIAIITAGLTGRDINKLIQRAGLFCLRNAINKGTIDGISISEQDINNALLDILPCPVLPMAKLDDIAGLHAVKSELIAITHGAHYYEKFGKTQPKSVLFFGPSGCGKTTLARAFANELDADLITISPLTLMKEKDLVKSPCVIINDIFMTAKARSPVVLHFEDIFEEQWKSFVDAITCEMKIIEKDALYVIMETSRPSLLSDRTFISFDAKFFVPLPDQEARMMILKKLLENTETVPNDDIKTLARVTSEFSGSDLQSLVQHAVKEAVQEAVNIDQQENFVVQRRHFEYPLQCHRRGHHHTSALLKEFAPYNNAEVGAAKDATKSNDDDDLYN